MARHIVALGGGGFGGEYDDRMNEYLLGLTGRQDPRVCLIPTASGDSPELIVAFYRWFLPDRCSRSHLGLFWRDDGNLREFLLSQHLIFVGGGNTANMLAIWRVHGVDGILREAWEQGIVLCGVSAGALCWFDGGVTDSFGPSLAPLHDGLGFLEGTLCPHYDGEIRRRPTYQRCVLEGLPGGVGVENNVGLHFVDGSLSEIVSSRPGGGAFRVEREAGGVREIPLSSRFLGSSPA